MSPTPSKAVRCPECGGADVYREPLCGLGRVYALFRRARPYICDGCWCRFWRPTAGDPAPTNPSARPRPRPLSESS